MDRRREKSAPVADAELMREENRLDENICAIRKQDAQAVLRLLDAAAEAVRTVERVQTVEPRRRAQVHRICEGERAELGTAADNGFSRQVDKPNKK